MARPLRIQAAGLTYHVTSRGNNRMAVYLDDDDRHWFLALVARVVELQDVAVYSVCLMSNHYHLVLGTRRPNLSRSIKELNGRYAQWWNRRHARVGHVFQARFHSQVIENDSYLLTACAYDALNPVRAGIVPSPEKWPWSSYAALGGFVDLPPFLDAEFVWSLIGPRDRALAALRFRGFVDGVHARGEELPSDPVVGGPHFVEQFKEWRRRASREVPRKECRVRQGLDEIFTNAFTRRDRREAALRAYMDGYTAAEIARHLGLHYSTVSRMITAAAGPLEGQVCLSAG